MITELPLYNEILILSIDFIGIWLAFIAYKHIPKKKLSKIFLGNIFLMFVWVNFAYLARLIGRQQVYWALICLKIAWFATPLLFVFLYFLVVYYLNKEKEYRFLNKIILLAGGGTALITGFTGLVINKIKFVNGDLSILYGKGMLPFLGIVFLFMCAPLYLLFKEYVKSSPRAKIKIEYLLVGIFIFYLANIIFNITFPILLDIAHLYWIGDYSAIVLVSFIAYAIIKQELFGIKVVLTTVLVGLIGILLLIDALVFTEELLFRFIKGGVLIIFLFFGYLLIRSILREIYYREELRKAYEKLKKLDQAKSRFLSMASHQLRTPLTVIKGYISMILEGVYGEINKTVKEKLKRSYQSNERLTTLVRDLLNVSRIEAGKIEMKFEKVNLESLISVLIKELSIQAEKKRVFLKFERPDKKLPEISLDKEKITQVILNIIDNAIKYTEKGGVTVKIKKPISKKVQIIISDTGVGMTEEDIDSLFDIFTRGSVKTSLTTEGIGLGLYIAKRFIEIQKGKIWAESEGKGKGSTFYIELPIN